MRRALLVAAMCMAAGCGGSDDSAGCHEGDEDVTRVYAATGLHGEPPSGAALDDAARIVCERARRLDVRASVRREGSDRVAIGVPGGRERDLHALTRPGQLTFYDWEPNVFGDPYLPVNDLGEAVERARKAKPRAEATDVPDDRGNDTIGDKYYSLDADRNLIATTRAENSAKGDSTADEWVPSDPAYGCSYATVVVTVKSTYALSVTPAESQALESLLATC